MPFQQQVFIVSQNLISKGKGYAALRVLILMDFVRIFSDISFVRVLGFSLRALLGN